MRAAAAEFHSQSCCRHSAPHMSDSRASVAGRGAVAPLAIQRGCSPPTAPVWMCCTCWLKQSQRERSKSRVFVVVVLFSFSNKKKRAADHSCLSSEENEFTLVETGTSCLQTSETSEGFCESPLHFWRFKTCHCCPLQGDRSTAGPDLFSFAGGKSTSLKIDADEVEQTTSPPS